MSVAVHTKIMNYSDDLDKVLKNELSILIDKVRKQDIPFVKETIDMYHKMYKQTKKDELKI